MRGEDIREPGLRIEPFIFAVYAALQTQERIQDAKGCRVEVGG